MTEIHKLTREKLAHLVAETEETLSQLKVEMERRVEETQHHEIDKLEQHLNSAESGLRSVRDFFRMLADEFRPKS